MQGLLRPGDSIFAGTCSPLYLGFISRAMPSSVAASLTLSELPGHYIRRLQQIAVGVFMDETQAFGLTPVQFAALNAVMAQPDMDQRTLAAGIGFDASTIGGVVDRLEARGWVARQVSPEDRRARLLRVTPQGQQLLADVSQAVLKTQDRILRPLPQAQRQEFLRMLKVLVDANNEASRAPRSLE
jgi:DNA-binding MarR family transcriptional regulator